MSDDWPTLPGESPIDDISGLKVRGITTRAELNRYEARNILKATVRYLADRPSRKRAPFDLAWVFRLHEQMFGDVWAWAGQKRRGELNMGVPRHQIDTQLRALLDDLTYWCDETDMPLVEQAVRLHHRAVQIHPFENGNGRWARMLANVWLKQNGHAVVVWPEVDMARDTSQRDAYIDALKAADAGDYQPLITFHERYVEDDV